MNFKYPVYKPQLGGKEKEYVNECLESTWISSKGKFINLFEEAFAHYIGSSHAVSVANGTVALHVALEGLEIGPGDEVLVPSFTYIASVNAIRYCGATPVFIDSDPISLMIDMNQLEEKVTPNTKAIMAVHLYGDVTDMDPIIDFARKHSLAVIEDSAESFGSSYKGKHSGTIGTVGTFSFFGNKTITTGEGGMVVTSDEKLASRMRRIKGQGLAEGREYWHDIIGYNYRMTNICAAIGLAQLERADAIIQKKIALANRYFDGLKHLPVVLPRKHPQIQNSYWMVSLLVLDSTLRDALRHFLHENSIETRPFFSPVHLMPMYDTGLRLPVAEDLASRGINLPSYPELSFPDVDFICQKIQQFFET